MISSTGHDLKHLDQAGAGMHSKAVTGRPVAEAEIRSHAFTPAARIESDIAGGQRKPGWNIEVLIIIAAIGRIGDRVAEIVGGAGRRLAQLITVRGGDDAYVTAAADSELLSKSHRGHGIVEKSTRDEQILPGETAKGNNAEHAEQHDDADQLDQRKSGIVIILYYNHVKPITN
jgi:hypothetical protein